MSFIMKHLFILSPNNSGSTLLHNFLSTSPNLAHLDYKEGQDVSWYGPHPLRRNASRLFTRIENELKDEKRYDWNKIKKGWNIIWEKNNPNALVRLEKSPTNICRVNILKKEFENCFFIIMPRNPYAQAQSIKKYLPDVSYEVIAKHCLRCLEICTELSKTLDNSLFFSYEYFCNHYALIAENLVNNFMPELNVLNPNKKFKIHYEKPSFIKNMNEKYINKIKAIDSILKQGKDIMRYWGYEYEF